MDEVAHGGRTVLFVSHNMGAVQHLCQKAVLLEDGRLAAEGSAGEITARYLDTAVQGNLRWQRTDSSDAAAFFTKLSVVDSSGKDLSVVTTTTGIRFVMDFAVARRQENLCLSVGLQDGQGQQIFGTMPEDVGVQWSREPGSYRAVVDLPEGLLMAKPYRLVAALWIPYLGKVDVVEEISFQAQETDSFSAHNPVGRPGFLTVPCAWTVESGS